MAVPPRLWLYNPQSEIYDIRNKILYGTCFVHNSTQKASPEELQARIFTNLQFVKIRTYSSSVESEFNTKTLLLPKMCMRPWIRSLSHISPKRPLREYLMIPFIKYVHWTIFYKFIILYNVTQLYNFINLYTTTQSYNDIILYSFQTYIIIFKFYIILQF